MKKYKVTVDGRVFDVTVEEIADGGLGRRSEAVHVESTPGDPPAGISSHREPERIPAANSLTVEAPMPGSIINVSVKHGDSVDRGDVLLILEAMKMENEITAPRPGTVQVIHVEVGDRVSGGAPLVEIA